MGFAERQQGCHFRHEDELVANVPVLRIFGRESICVRLGKRELPKNPEAKALGVMIRRQ